MIKRYDQFINKKTNEEFVFGKDQIEDDIANEFGDNIDEPTLKEKPLLGGPESSHTVHDNHMRSLNNEFEEEEEGKDIYHSKLKELADTLGSEVVDNSIVYNGKKIIFPSETEKYHIEGYKKGFSTVDEVVKALEKEEGKRPQMTPEEEDLLTGERSGERSVGLDDLEDDEFQKFESKSYKSQRLRKFRK